MPHCRALSYLLAPLALSRASHILMRHILVCRLESAPHILRARVTFLRERATFLRARATLSCVVSRARSRECEHTHTFCSSARHRARHILERARHILVRCLRERATFLRKRATFSCALSRAQTYTHILSRARHIPERRATFSRATFSCALSPLLPLPLTHSFFSCLHLFFSFVLPPSLSPSPFPPSHPNTLRLHTHTQTLTHTAGRKRWILAQESLTM